MFFCRAQNFQLSALSKNKFIFKLSYGRCYYLMSILNFLLWLSIKHLTQMTNVAW